MLKQDLLKSDHDILITLVETVNNNHKNISDKILDVKADIGSIRDGISAQISNHEIRIKMLEELTVKIRLEDQVKRLDEVYDWMKGFRLTWKFVIGTSITVSSIIGFILGTIIQVLHLTRK